MDAMARQFLLSSEFTKDSSFASLIEEQLPIFMELLNMAEAKKPLTSDKLIIYYQMHASRNLEKICYDSIHLLKIDAFLYRMEKMSSKNIYDVVTFVEYLADQLVEFNKQGIFPKFNEHMVKFVLAYLLVRHGYPLFDFSLPVSVPYSFQEALHTPYKARCYCAEMIKNQIKDEGGYTLKFKHHYENSSEYASEESKVCDSVIAHWHGLNKKLSEWKERLKHE